MDLTDFLNRDLLFGLKVGNVVSFLAVMLVGYLVAGLVTRILKKADERLEPGSVYHAFFFAAQGPVRWAIFIATAWVAVFAAEAASRSKLPPPSEAIMRPVSESTRQAPRKPLISLNLEISVLIVRSVCSEGSR